MKKVIKFLVLMASITLVIFAFPSPVSADAPESGRTIFGETYTLGTGEILDGDLTVFGGVVTIEKGAVVSGDVNVFGSVININGTIEGNLSMYGGTLTLEDNAVIEGDLTSASSYIYQSPGAVIEGDFTHGISVPWTELDLTNIPVPQIITSAPLQISYVLTNIAEFFGLLLAAVALGALLILITPKSIDVMNQALMAKPWEILAYGALTTAAMLVGGILLSLTICMIPVVALVGLAFLLAILAGWLSLGVQLGKIIETGIFKTSWHPALTAALGNAVLFLLSRGLAEIPCLGTVLVVLAALFGLGMAVVTLFGTNPYPRAPKDSQPEILSPENAPEITPSPEKDQEIPADEKESTE